MAVRYADCTRRQHRNREASETRFAQTADASLSDFGTGDVSPSNGFHCNGNDHFKSNRNCRCAERQRQPQLSLRGTSKATATVATRNVKGNRNGRCAERQRQLQLGRRKRLTSTTIAAPNVGLPSSAPTYEKQGNATARNVTDPRSRPVRPAVHP